MKVRTDVAVVYVARGNASVVPTLNAIQQVRAWMRDPGALRFFLLAGEQVQLMVSGDDPGDARVDEFAHAANHGGAVRTSIDEVADKHKTAIGAGSSDAETTEQCIQRVDFAVNIPDHREGA